MRSTSQQCNKHVDGDVYWNEVSTKSFLAPCFCQFSLASVYRKKPYSGRFHSRVLAVSCSYNRVISPTNNSCPLSLHINSWHYFSKVLHLMTASVENTRSKKRADENPIERRPIPFVTRLNFGTRQRVLLPTIVYTPDFPNRSSCDSPCSSRRSGKARCAVAIAANGDEKGHLPSFSILLSTSRLSPCTRRPRLDKTPRQSSYWSSLPDEARDFLPFSLK